MLGQRLDAEETDRTLNALSHASRRRLLFKLYEELNSGEGERINYTEIPSLSAEKKRILLYHTHLPKLETFGYIKWNEVEKTIQKGPQWEEIEPLLELLSSHLCELPQFLQGKPPDTNGTKC